MNSSVKEIQFDEDLQIEAYRFTGFVRQFPYHFHDYYVVGLIEAGERCLTVNQQNYNIGPGDFLTLNPMDSHACEQTDGGALGYRCFNIKMDVWAGFTGVAGENAHLPRFREPVQYHSEWAPAFCRLHDGIMSGGAALEKEEQFLLFVRQLASAYADAATGGVLKSESIEIERICAYLETHYAQRITLEALGKMANLNKYTLLRTFTRIKGITPYRYLETVRIGKARELLEKGLEPAQVAQQTGFSDQSHFTSYFTRFIGLGPGQYRAIFRGELK